MFYYNHIMLILINCFLTLANILMILCFCVIVCNIILYDCFRVIIIFFSAVKIICLRIYF